MLQTFITTLNQWDRSVCLKIFDWSGRAVLNRIMFYASRMGDGHIYPVICLAILILDRSTAKTLLQSLFLSFLIELPVQRLLKHGTRRPRPFKMIKGIRNLIAPPDDFSFPSGHTAGAFIVAIHLANFYPFLLLPCLFLAGWIGLSRVYNGVHYPSDVLAGMLLGISCAKIGLIII